MDLFFSRKFHTGVWTGRFVIERSYSKSCVAFGADSVHESPYLKVSPGKSKNGHPPLYTVMNSGIPDHSEDELIKSPSLKGVPHPVDTVLLKSHILEDHSFGHESPNASLESKTLSGRPTDDLNNGSILQGKKRGIGRVKNFVSKHEMNKRARKEVCDSRDEGAVEIEFLGDGFRRIKPYYFEYQTFAKQRWLGRRLLDVFSREFRDRPVSYFREAISRGLIRLSGQPCNLDSVIEPSDMISHMLHRHEPPVVDEAPLVIFRDNDLLVVSKPASVPMHPSGRYRHNTLLSILKYNHKFTENPLPSTLSIINRLDRLTSGICMIGLNEAAAVRMHKLMEGGGWFEKEYIALVKGVFPLGDIVSHEPLRMIEHKLGLVVVDHNLNVSKTARTRFQRLATDGFTWSLVRCWPETGRTHQIRVHLLHLGYPISNDPLYAHPVWESPENYRSSHPASGLLYCGDRKWSDPPISESNTPPSALCTTNESPESDFKSSILDSNDKISVDIKNSDLNNSYSSIETTESSVQLSIVSSDSRLQQNDCKNLKESTENVHGTVSSQESIQMRRPYNQEEIEIAIGVLMDEMRNRNEQDKINEETDATAEDGVCLECIHGVADPIPEEMCIYLHAHRYSCPEWSFEAPLPAWARDII